MSSCCKFLVVSVCQSKLIWKLVESGQSYSNRVIKRMHVVFLDDGVYKTSCPCDHCSVTFDAYRICLSDKSCSRSQIVEQRWATKQVEWKTPHGWALPFPFPFPPASRLFCDRPPAIWRRFVGSNIRRVIMFVDRSELQLTIFGLDARCALQLRRLNISKIAYSKREPPIW